MNVPSVLVMIALLIDSLFPMLSFLVVIFLSPVFCALFMDKKVPHVVRYVNRFFAEKLIINRQADNQTKLDIINKLFSLFRICNSARHQAKCYL